MSSLARTRDAIFSATKSVSDATVGALTAVVLRTARSFDAEKTANMLGRVARLIGPLLPEQRIGRANLIAAFPEKSTEEIESILDGVWDNLGRMGAEFAHLDHIWDHDEYRPENCRVELAPGTREMFHQLRLDGK